MCETQTTNNKEVEVVVERTPIKLMSADEKKLYYKKIAIKHYSNPANKLKQANRMKILMSNPKTRLAHNNKVSKNRRLKTLAKRLGIIWVNKGMIKINSLSAITSMEVKVTCICGSTMNKSGVRKHEKTLKHRIYIQSS